MEGEVLEEIAAADQFRGRGTAYLHLPRRASVVDKADRTEASNGDNNNANPFPFAKEDHSDPTGAVVVPISLATTFKQKMPGIPSAHHDPNSFGLGYEYSRTGNPTRGAFERAVAVAENARFCVAFSSGSASTSAVIQAFAKHGDHVVCVDDVYGGTQRYFRRLVCPQMGITFGFQDFSDHDNISFPERTKLVWLETPTNPTLKISDIAAVSAMCSRQADRSEGGCLLAVDNTFCSPYFQNPLELGADLVVHSVTKYIGGHSDVVMGVVCCNRQDLYEKLRFVQNNAGAVPSPFDCFLAHRGLKTLHVRMEAASRNAQAIALFLENHKAVKRVLYPGLKSHPQHALAKKQQYGFGAIITFYCIGGRFQSATFLKELQLFTLAESLGAVESLAECPSLMTHASVPEDQRELLGIDDSLIRLSIGIESCRDLVLDLDRALNAAMETCPAP